jgi:hypothetical protein
VALLTVSINPMDPYISYDKFAL